MFLNMLFYVITIVICTITATLYVRFVFRRNGILYRIVSVLLISFVFYAILEMFVTIFTELYIPKSLFYTMTTLSDVAFFCLVAAWISTIVILSGNPYLVRIKGFVIYTSIYGIAVDGLNLVSKLSPFTFGLTIREVSNIQLVLNCAFDVTTIFISIFFAGYSLVKMKGEKQQKIVLFFSACLAFYMVYITNWDIISCTDIVPNHILFSSFDPAHIFFVVMCIIFLYMTSKKEMIRTDYYMPEMLGITDENKEIWDQLAKQYKLTSRELELLAVMGEGLSNPDIAKKLYISESTVKQHLSHIYKKTNVKNRYELMQKFKM